MAEFDLHLEGVAEPLLIEDERFGSAAAMTDYLDKQANRPKWIRLGGVTIFSQNIIAVEAQETES